MHWQKVTLIGVGLLGGSLGLAIRQRKIAGSVHAFVRRETSLLECQNSNAVDFTTLDLCEAVTDADLVILCTPIAQMKSLAEKFAPCLKKGAIVTDVGSTKKKLVDELVPIISNAGAEFIGSHPMAGSDRSGVKNAEPSLFEKAVCAITPTEANSEEVIKEINAFWKATGCSTLTLTPDAHDELVSRCSHLPHILASELVHYALSSKFSESQSLLSGTGFRDASRLASGSPEVWRDICLTNRKNLISTIDEFSKQLNGFKELLDDGNASQILEYFSTAKKLRDQWVNDRFDSET